MSPRAKNVKTLVKIWDLKNGKILKLLECLSENTTRFVRNTDKIMCFCNAAEIGEFVRTDEKCIIGTNFFSR